MSKNKFMVKASNGEEISLNDLRDQVQKLACEDERFTKPPEGSDTAAKAWGCSVWVADILQGDGDFDAIIQAQDGKLYQVSFTLDDDGDVDELEDDATEVTRKTQYVSASYTALFFNGQLVTAADGEVTGKPSMHARVGKMEKAVGEAVKADPRFSVPGNSGQPYAVDILVPDADGKHHAVVRKNDGKLVKHGFSYDAESDAATLDEGDPTETECTAVYAAWCKAHDETVKAGGPGSGRKPGGAIDDSDESKAKYESQRVAAVNKSADAYTQSVKANGSGDPQEHLRAASLHREAAVAHGNAEMDSAVAHGDDHNTKYHEQMGNEHRDRIKLHQDAAQLLNKQAAESRRALNASEKEKLSQIIAATSKELPKLVTAAGSTPGALSGHASRKSKLAETATASANEASVNADKNNNPEQHDQAAVAHRDASAAHLAAMQAHVKAGSDAEVIKGHATAMAEHDAKADAHVAKCEPVTAAQPAVAAETPKEDKNIVHCRAAAPVLTKQAEAWTLDKPAKLMWMPAGVSTVSAGFDGRTIHLTVECDEETAKVAKASYKQWREDMPKQKPFLCVEHREQESAGEPIDFGWQEDGDPGVYCSLIPSGLGVKNVNERIHRSFSPSFTTDADYAHASCQDCSKQYGVCKCGGALQFPDGVRGSASNPAKVTGIGFSVGSLTNKPAFTTIAPVKARKGGEAKPEEEEPSAAEKATATANEKSETANGSKDDGEAHHEAAMAHYDAAEEHGKAAVEASKENDHDAVKAHEKESVAHMRKGDQHSAKANAALARVTARATKREKPMGAVLASATVSEQDKLDLIFASLAQANDAKQASPPAQQNGAQPKGQNPMKIKIIKAHGEYKQVGTVVEVDAATGATLIAGGYGVDAVQAAEQERLANEVKAASEARITDAVVRAKDRGAIQPKDTVKAEEYLKKFREQNYPAEAVVELINSLPGVEDTVMASRMTAFQAKENGLTGRVEITRVDPVDAAIKACEMKKPVDGLIKAGRITEAHQIGLESSRIIRDNIVSLVKAGHDFSIKDMVRAGDVTDANVGVLAGSLVLMRNLGYLKNILNFMPYISTDLRNEPALFNQPVYTRYIVPPSVTSYNSVTGWSDSTPSTKDVSVTMNKHNGVQITFPTSLLGQTMRALFAEQFSAQTYALGEQVVKDFLISLFGATWNGVVPAKALGGNAFNLQSFVSLKNIATLAKLPPVGRFAMLHSTYHDQVLADTNLVTAKAIMALVNKDMTAFESAELPTLYGVKPLESQLSAATNAVNTGAAGVLGAATVDNTGAVTFPGITAVGFLGNMSSMLMVARIPQDYTQAFKDIPSTAAIEIVTDPDSGLSMLNCKYVNHQLASVSNRLSLMYGFGQGDSRQGIILTP